MIEDKMTKKIILYIFLSILFCLIHKHLSSPKIRYNNKDAKFKLKKILEQNIGDVSEPQSSDFMNGTLIFALTSNSYQIFTKNNWNHYIYSGGLDYSPTRLRNIHYQSLPFTTIILESSDTLLTFVSTVGFGQISFFFMTKKSAKNTQNNIKYHHKYSYDLAGFFSGFFLQKIDNKKMILMNRGTYLVKYDYIKREEISKLLLFKNKGENGNEKEKGKIVFQKFVRSYAYMSPFKEYILLHSPYVDTLTGVDLSNMKLLKQENIKGIEAIYDISTLASASLSDFALYTWYQSCSLQIWNALDAKSGYMQKYDYVHYFEVILEFKLIENSDFVITTGKDRRISILHLYSGVTEEKASSIEICRIFLMNTPITLDLDIKNREVLVTTLDRDDEDKKITSMVTYLI